MYSTLVDFIRKTFNTPKEFIPLHEPRFIGNEKKYVIDAIDSTFVSSVGEYVTKFEEMICEITGSKYSVATVNGTSALHLALIISGVNEGDEVLTQSLTFVATANAISYIKAIPHFVDVDKETLGMSPTLLDAYLMRIAEVKDGECFNKKTGNKISACVPMHTFGLPMYIDKLVAVCNKYCIPVIEDGAESLGSTYKEKHLGTYGKLGVFSFNGNKIITSGGGGVIITDDEQLAKQAKHLSTTAKIPHKWDFKHDEIGYNYRMPNLNAALVCAQLEQLNYYLSNKRELSDMYMNFFNQYEDYHLVREVPEAKSNYWLNALLLRDEQEKEKFLNFTNDKGIMTRPVWELMSNLSIYKDCENDGLLNSKWLADRLVNIPSSVRII